MRSYKFNGGTGRRGFGIGPVGISPFIKWMILFDVVVFIAQNIYPQMTYALGLSPKAFFSDFPNKLYQPVTYMFLHGGIWHILFNMFALWMFGTEVEFTWGSKRFGKFYFLAGIAGAVLSMIVRSSQIGPIIGASAAIYGVLVAYWIMFPERYLYIYFLLPIKVKWAIPGVMLLGFLFGGPHIAHFAHLGGALFGLVYMKADWRWLRFGDKFKKYKYSRQTTKLEKNRQRAEEIMKRVDEILDKINEVGIENISKEDRKFLEEASSKLSGKKINEQG